MEYYGVSFVLVSFHVEHNGLTDVEKKAKLIEFINKMHAIANAEKVPVIVGGDFSLDVEIWRDEFMREFEDRVNVAPLYNRVPDRPHSTKIIDTFLVIYPEFTQEIVTFHIPIPMHPTPKHECIGSNKTKLDNY